MTTETMMINKLVRYLMGRQPINQYGLFTRALLPAKREDKFWNVSIDACNKNSIDDGVIHMPTINLKLKKVISIKPSIQIKFGLHYYLSYSKTFKTRPHLPIFIQYFL